MRGFTLICLFLSMLLATVVCLSGIAMAASFSGTPGYSPERASLNATIWISATIACLVIDILLVVLLVRWLRTPLPKSPAE